MDDDLTNILGKHLIYTYDNGWQYEIYIKNEKTLDYRIHSGIVGNRWVKDQQVHLVKLSLSSNIFKISWNEPTGTSVSLAINFDERHLHGTIFFPRWIIDQPEKTICFQNEHLNQMQKYRDLGPTYPIEVIDEFAKITFVETCQLNDESIIACEAKQLSDEYVKRKN
jgi:phenolic acid decarboxylase